MIDFSFFFLKYISFYVALWATRQTEKDLRKNKDLYVKTTLRELILYLIFVTILCISKYRTIRFKIQRKIIFFKVTFGMTSSKTYYFTTVLQTLLTEKEVQGIGDQPSFDDIVDFDDYWSVRMSLSNIFF